MPGGSSEFQQAQGAGWLEAEFDSLAYLNVGEATLTLRLNSTALPLGLRVVVAVEGLPAPKKFSVIMGNRSQVLPIDISSWPDGEFAVQLAPGVHELVDHHLSTRSGGQKRGLNAQHRKALLKTP